jgi:hypothetical protein
VSDGFEDIQLYNRDEEDTIQCTSQLTGYLVESDPEFIKESAPEPLEFNSKPTKKTKLDDGTKLAGLNEDL